MRISEITRKTSETDITLSLNIDGRGKSNIDTGCGFLDHMLALFARHARFDLTIKCVGDTEVDYHHTVEDVGIVLGMAFSQAVGDKRGIRRYGYSILPMDEALILCAVDVSGRSYLDMRLEIPTEKVGDFDTELVEEFFLAFTRKAEITLHTQKMTGTNSHHIIEGAFKAIARCLKDALVVDPMYKDEVPSTKGVL